MLNIFFQVDFTLQTIKWLLEKVAKRTSQPRLQFLAEALLERSLKKTFAQRKIRMTELSRQHVYSLLYI